VIVANPVQDQTLDQLFRTARTQNKWTDKPVAEELIRELYDLLKWGPTSANTCPARFIWVRSEAGKAKLSGHAMAGNRAKILAAPVTVIVGFDLDFSAVLPKLNPARGAAMQEVFKVPAIAEVTAMRNGSLQGGYLIMAARALGLDCGPMSGFDNAAVDADFFAGTRIKSNFICSLGYGDPDGVYPRNPRLTFDEAGSFA
jgi:3-hydroxypropanoate dehydrogenase